MTFWGKNNIDATLIRGYQPCNSFYCSNNDLQKINTFSTDSKKIHLKIVEKYFSFLLTAWNTIFITKMIFLWKHLNIKDIKKQITTHK